MDIGDPHRSEDDGGFSEDELPRKRELPSDLPTSLNDRRPVRSYAGETEMYDGWQGQTQYLTSSAITSPLKFNLSLDDDTFDTDFRGHTTKTTNDDSKLTAMLAAQAAHRDDGTSAESEETILADESLSEKDKRAMLQKSLHMAASNGDIDRVRRLVTGKAKELIDINAADEEGTAPLIYASCFGHHEVVTTLLGAGADVNRQDRNQWTPLMWAMTNRHQDIAKILLDHGASPGIKSSSGRTAYDFAPEDGEMLEYLSENGYQMGEAGIGDDFYHSGFSQDRFEQEMEENEMKRRMMMESSVNLEVDLSSLGMDERPETPEEAETEQQDFVWDRCLNDQMFVFQESELDRILDIIITNMVPKRSPSQKPVPANILFLSARYAHYHANPDLLARLLVSAMDKINVKVERHQWDMTVLAFWISNATLLLHYLKKDAGLVQATTEFQLQLAELINEIYILIIRDAERRMDKVLDIALLDYETMPGFEDIQFANDWNFFKSKHKTPQPESLGVRPPPPNRRAQPSPRNITSLLNSTLFVLDLYDVHSVITTQIIAQIFYWIGAELFNHMLENKIFLARSKAMQIRMNVSVLEDWARSNNRIPEHFENGSMTASGESTVEAIRKYLTPTIELLQWLQCFSSLGDDQEAFDNLLKQLSHLSPTQLLHSSQNYRWEVGEKGSSNPKLLKKRLQGLQTEMKKRREKIRQDRIMGTGATTPQIDSKAQPSRDHSHTPPQTPQLGKNEEPSSLGPSPIAPVSADEEDIENENLLQDPAHMLQFSLPTSVDLRLSYGAGYGGTNRERARKYIPTVPPEFLSKLDVSGNGNGGGNGSYGAESRTNTWDRRDWDD
ncbi:hypothetical protein MMC25_004344 [Agyrium rufum]|nr:hypothetical protein [Agyrium rufum]